MSKVIDFQKYLDHHRHGYSSEEIGELMLEGCERIVERCDDIEGFAIVAWGGATRQYSVFPFGKDPDLIPELVKKCVEDVLE